MSNEIELVKKKEQKALIIRDSVGMLKLPKVMGPAYMKIFNYLKEKNFEPAEAPFTGYLVDNWDEAVNMSGLKMFLSVFTKKWDIEMGFAVPDHIEGHDNMEITSLPAGEYRLRMWFSPASALAGLAISLSALAITFLAIVITYMKNTGNRRKT